MNRFSSVLVANRGEIAVRVLRSAAAAGYRTIAVYSEADAQAPHVALADEATLIGPAPVQESYLDPERILAAAARTGATAIHPGYGFLSENADFARACEERGIVFIGPSPDAIALMGNKAAAKRRMLEAGVPCVPGYQSENQSDEALLAAAGDIGLPLMVKAAAGGGGRGMRLVEASDELPGAIAAARSEALNAFGSDELILEKAVLRPRHVEIQVFGDRHGALIHLGERDCSVQRRHQKVIEESPCPVMNDRLREAMGQAAVAAARSIGYVGAGTVEFLLDEAGAFYFLEMNTRLQVEHPVTECVTGLDLVDLQLQIAQGATLPISQTELCLRGHAIEARLYAEDVTGGFLPASGTALLWRAPVGEGIRVDHGLAPGLEISPFYDPMLAKVIACGPDRETARRRLLRALGDTQLMGVETNLEFLMSALRREAFIAGDATTAFIAEEYPSGFSAGGIDHEFLSLAAVLEHRQSQARALTARVHGEKRSPALRAATRLRAHYAYRVDDALQHVNVLAIGQGQYRVAIADSHCDVRILRGAGDVSRDNALRVSVDGIQSSLGFCIDATGVVHMQWRGRGARLANEMAGAFATAEPVGSGAVLAPMHGNLLTLNVSIGDAVRAGDELAVMEAMKMEHRIRAGIDGQVVAIHARSGEQLSAGALLLEIE